METTTFECCVGTCKTHETVSDNGNRWLLCCRHAAELRAEGHLVVVRLRLR